MAHSTRLKTENLEKWYSSNANPANRVREIFSSQFKPGASNATYGEIQVSKHQSRFKGHVNTTNAFYEQTPRGFSQESLQNSMKDVHVVANFLSPTVNINRYKAFPQYTEAIHNRVTDGPVDIKKSQPLEITWPEQF